jgi:hypothetical protein
MRAIVASIVVTVLVGLLAVCPLMACAMAPEIAAHHGCCRKSPQPQPTRCPLPSVQDCPYFILEKGKTSQTTAQVSVVACQPITAIFRVADQFFAARTETRLPDSAGLYLRVRVLLI